MKSRHSIPISTQKIACVWLLNELYNPVHERNTNQLNLLFEQHLETYPESVGGFWYKTRLWCNTGRLKFKAMDLKLDLHPQMKIIARNIELIEDERVYVESLFSFLFTNFPTEYVHAFIPESLHPVLKNRNIPMVRYEPTEEDWTKINTHNNKGVDALRRRILLNLVD